MQSHICQNIHSSASTIPTPTFSFPSFNLPSPGSPPLPTCPPDTHSSPLLPPPPPTSFILFLPSNPTFCLSSPMLLAHFLPFIEILSHQLHFRLCLSKDTRLQIKVAYFYFFHRNWKPGKINPIQVFNTSSHLQV